MADATVTVTLDRLDAEELFDHLGAFPLGLRLGRSSWDDRVWAVLGDALGREGNRQLRARILDTPVTIGGGKAW